MRNDARISLGGGGLHERTRTCSLLSLSSASAAVKATGSTTEMVLTSFTLTTLWEHKAACHNTGGRGKGASAWEFGFRKRVRTLRGGVLYVVCMIAFCLRSYTIFCPQGKRPYRFSFMKWAVVSIIRPPPHPTFFYIPSVTCLAPCTYVLPGEFVAKVLHLQ